MEEKQYSWVDLESGVRYPCSKEHYEGMLKLWESCKPKNIKLKNPVIIVGTSPIGVSNWSKDLFNLKDRLNNEDT